MKKTFLLVLFLCCLISTTAFAQQIDSTAAPLVQSTVYTPKVDSATTKSKFSVDAGIDVLNNFIWRGIPLDMGPNLQPTLIVGYGNLKVSFLGSYSFKYNFNNIMTLMTYDIAVGSGTLTPNLTHYYYPYDATKLSDYRRTGESFSHTTEAGITYLGTKVPLRIFTSVNFVNDPEKSTYGEAGYKFKIQSFGFEPFVGVVFTESPTWHAAEKPGLLNVGFNTSKTIKISDKYGLPLTGTLSYHTQMDMLNVMVRLSIF